MKFRAAVLIRYGDVCHLCGQPGADSADHVPARKYLPEADWFNTDYARPAHIHCNQVKGTNQPRPSVVQSIDTTAFFDTG